MLGLMTASITEFCDYRAEYPVHYRHLDLSVVMEMTTAAFTGRSRVLL